MVFWFGEKARVALASETFQLFQATHGNPHSIVSKIIQGIFFFVQMKGRYKKKVVLI